MRFPFWSLAGSALSVVAAACSSAPNSPAPAQPLDAGDDSGGIQAGEDAGLDTEGGAAPDASGSGTCDASLPVALPVDAGGACTQCTAQRCATELGQCAADCTCGPIEACLEQRNLNFTACPNAINAVMGGNPPLTNLTQCLDKNCLMPCFQSNSEGGGADSGSQ